MADQGANAAVVRTAVGLAESAGLADIERRLRALHDGAPRPLPRMVCVGMEKVGKSTLVNALVGRPLLSPVGDDVVTATYIAITPGDTDHAVAIVVDAAEGRAQRVPVELDHLADYVAVDAVHEGVVGAEVSIVAPFLPGVEILDTPGHGGMNAGHNAVTMASLDSAQTLLFLMQPGAPLCLPELQFLTEAARRTNNIVLAMTKIDLHPEWRSIRDDNLALISRHVPELAAHPILPVSSKLAEQAARGGARSEVVQQLLSVSGVHALIDEIRTRTVHGSAASAEAWQRDALLALLGELRARLAERPSYLAGDGAALAAVRAERDRLRSFLNDPQFGALELNRRLQRLRRDAERDFDLAAATLLDRYATNVEYVSSGQLRELPLLLRGELAELIVNAIADIDREVTGILDGLEKRVGPSLTDDALRAQLATAVQPEISEHRHTKDWGEHMSTVIGATVAASGTWIFAGVVAAGPVMIALGAATVATVGLHEFLRTRTEGRRQGLRLWIDRARRDVTRSFDQACGQRLDPLEHLVTVDLPQRLDSRITQIDDLTTLSTGAAATERGPAPSDVDALLVAVDNPARRQ